MKHSSHSGNEATARAADRNSPSPSNTEQRNHADHSVEKTRPSGRRHTGIIGYYSSTSINARNPFEAELIGGLLRGCSEEDKNLLLLGAHDGSPARLDALLADITGGKIDGLIARFKPLDPLRDSLRSAHFPTVTLADPYPGLPSVMVDDMGGFRQMAHYLADQGHQRILFRGYAGKVSAARRRGGFQDVATQRGLTVLEDLMLQTDSVSALEAEILQRHDDYGDRVTAVACWTDSAARVTLKFADTLGLHVPGDLAIVGFNGLPDRYELLPHLTTVRAPWHAVAAQSVQILCELMRGHPVPDLTTLPVALVVGDTA